MKVNIALVLISLLIPTVLSARTWVNTKGQKVEGEFVRFDGDTHLYVEIKGKEHRLAITDLSANDQTWLKEKKIEQAKPKKASLLGVDLKPGRNVIPMDTSNYGFFPENKKHSEKSNIFLHLPEGFDPSKQYNVMITLGTSSGANSKQSNSLRHFIEDGYKQGWIVMTSDSVKGRPPKYTLNWRITMIDAALDYIEAEWPAAKKWNLVAGGSSGGAKAAQGVLAVMGSKAMGERNIAGLFLSGCNEATYLDIVKKSKPRRAVASRVAVFASQGLNDKVAPPRDTKAVLKILSKEGIKKQNYVEHPSGHSVYKPHVKQAFEWLDAHCAELDAEAE